MLVNYQYRTYPDTNQKLQLNDWLRICRYWYNSQLGQRFTWWNENRSYCIIPLGETCNISCTPQPAKLREQPNYYNQKTQLPQLKQDLILVKHSGELLNYKSIPSQTLQNVSKRVDESFSRFIKGDLNGKRSGKPRFKTEATYKTMLISGQAINIERTEKNWLFVSIPKLQGWLKVRLHRPLLSGFEIKNALITKKADGWYVTFALEDKSVPSFNPDSITATWENSLGMDAVLHEDIYLATSEGEQLPSLKSFRKNEASLAKVSKRKAARKRGTSRRRKLAKREARIHQRIARSRTDHSYKTSHKIVRSGKKCFFIESLNLRGLTKKNKAKQDETGKYVANGQSAKAGLNKSWNDAAFGKFFTTLEYIAEKAGSKVIAVNPSYTSQILSYRDELIFIDTSIREYYDEKEMFCVDRDVNAAINIKRVGLELFPTIKRRKGKSTKRIDKKHPHERGETSEKLEVSSVVIDSSRLNVDAKASTLKEILKVLRRFDIDKTLIESSHTKASPNFCNDASEA